MSKILEISGQRFGRLTAIEPTGESDNYKCRLWRFHCDCGRDVVLPARTIMSGRQNSCGCLRKETSAKHLTDLQAEKLERRSQWADSMVDEHHAKFWADGYVYVVSDLGEIYGPSGKLAQKADNKGYMRFKRKSVHRLVAMKFVPGYFDGAEVDHINRNRADNRKENLRWVTPEENKEYARPYIIAANKARATVQANQR